MIRNLIRTGAALAMAGALACGLAQPALARPVTTRPVTDCPLRDAPFSVNSPLVDILLSPAARKLVEDEAHTDFSKGPARFTGTTPPTFAAILTLKEAGMFTRLPPEAMTALDAKLHALPVTAADRVARCARYDNDMPRFDLPQGRPHVLLFEKINGFRDDPSVKAAHEAFLALAARKGWAVASTDKGGAINPATLRRFDAVIWNNISGDVLTLSQRAALKGWLERGGAFVGVHGAGGDPAYFWDWYADSLLGARFIGHPMNPQFQEARVMVEGKGHPIAKALPAEWTMTDEWYSFARSPRTKDITVIAALDEGSYKPGQRLTMGDHPIAWSHCIGRGRAFYSAIGHRPETYSQPQNLAMLEAALTWAIADKQACPARP